MSEWVRHCQEFQKKNQCSYKDAMKHARATYKPVVGGSMKSIIRKGKKLGNKVNHAIVKSVNEFDDEFNTNVKKTMVKEGNAISKRAKKNHIGRQAKNTAIRMGKETLNEGMNALVMTNPELAAPVAVGKQVLMGSGKKRLGSGKNPYLGGSFMTHGGSFMTHDNMSGGCYKPGHTESSMLPPQHPAFHPLPKKSYRKSKYEN